MGGVPLRTPLFCVHEALCLPACLCLSVCRSVGISRSCRECASLHLRGSSCCFPRSWDYIDNINPAAHKPPAPSQPPLLLVHGTADTTVPYREAVALQTRANQTGLPNAMISIPGAGHVPQQQLIEDGDYLERMLAFMSANMDLEHAECPVRNAGPVTPNSG